MTHYLVPVLRKRAEHARLHDHENAARDIEEAANVIDRLTAVLNTPELHDFAKALPLEGAHQIMRWGEAHDRSKSAENWFWLVGYLSGKALRANIEGDRDGALHHTISAATALSQWHMAIMRATVDDTGVGVDADMLRIEAEQRGAR